MSEETNNIVDESRVNYLDKDSYDAIVVGTGFIESLVAGALSRAGKSVLHLDENCYYGVNCSSFTLNQINDMLLNTNNNKQPVFKNTSIYHQQLPKQEEEVTSPAPTTEKNKEEKDINNNTTDDNKVEESTTNTNTEEQKEEQKVEQKQQEQPKKEFKDVLKLGRQFIIDLFPSLLYAKGALVQLLISSSTSKYLEFKTLDKNYLYTNNKLQAIPSTKGSIFKDNTFSLKEKRSIMKFIESVRSIVGEVSEESTEADESNNKNNSNTETLETVSKKYKNFYEFVKSYQLSSNVETFIFYGISLIHPRNIEDIAVDEGIKSVILYMSSLLVYGESPFLIPYYGYGDIPQAFCRLSAVFGGTYVLDRSIGSLSFDSNGNYSGLTCTAGQSLKSKYLIGSPSVFSSHIQSDKLTSQYTKEQYSRCVCITDKMISNSAECSYITVPPNTIAGNKNTINIYQMENICTARGFVLIHFTTLSSGKTAQEDLQAIVETFAQKDCLLDEKKSNEKPNIYWCGYFNMDLDTAKKVSDQTLPNGIIATSDSPVSPSIDYAAQINEAKSIFEKIAPGISFLEKVPDSEDIIWNSDETTTDTKTTTTTEEKTDSKTEITAETTVVSNNIEESTNNTEESTDNTKESTNN